MEAGCEEGPCAELIFPLRMTQLGKIRASRGRLNFPRPSWSEGCKSDSTNVLYILLKHKQSSTVHADSYLDGTRELCWVQQKPVTKDYVLEDTIALMFFKEKIRNRKQAWSGLESGGHWMRLYTGYLAINSPITVLFYDNYNSVVLLSHPC